jgi:ketosteroid isomerase-like protein
MNHRLYVAIFLCPLLAALSCEFQLQPSNVEADAAAIRSVWKEQEMVAYNNGDACADTTSNGVFIPENSPPIVGQSAIRSWCESLFDEIVFDVNPTIDELVVQGDWAFAVGTWRGRVRPKGGGDWTEIENGTIAIYRRQEDGAWKLARAIWNSNKPVD